MAENEEEIQNPVVFQQDSASGYPTGYDHPHCFCALKLHTTTQPQTICEL